MAWVGSEIAAAVSQIRHVARKTGLTPCIESRVIIRRQRRCDSDQLESVSLG